MSFRWLLASLLIGSVLATNSKPREEVCDIFDGLNITKAFSTNTNIFFGDQSTLHQLVIDTERYVGPLSVDETVFANRGESGQPGLFLAAVHFGLTPNCSWSGESESDPSTNTSVRGTPLDTSNPGADPDADANSTSLPPGSDSSGANADCTENRDKARDLVLVVHTWMSDHLRYTAYTKQQSKLEGDYFTSRGGGMPWQLKYKGNVPETFWLNRSQPIDKYEYMAMTFMEQAMTLYVSVLEHRGQSPPTPATYHKTLDPQTRNFGEWKRRDNTSYSYVGLLDYGGRLFGILANQTVVEIDPIGLNILGNYEGFIPLKQFFGCNGTYDNPGWVSPFEWGKLVNEHEVLPDLEEVPSTSAPDLVTTGTAGREQTETTTKTTSTKPTSEPKSSAWIIFLIIAIIIIIIVILVIVCLCCGKKSEDAKAADGQKGGAGGAQTADGEAALGQPAEAADSAGQAKSATGGVKSETAPGAPEADAGTGADTSSQDSKALAGVSKSESSIKSDDNEPSVRSDI